MTPTSSNRRRFLAASAAFSVVAPGLVRGTTRAEAVTIGLIGCGGRGSWIAKLFEDSGRYRVLAAHDYFADRVEPLAEKFNIPRSHCFTGLSGYKKLLETPVDAVVIESPPYFHPRQAADSVEAAKHVFLAKPIAVDVPGCQSIAQSGELATRRNRVFLVDFQTRTNPHHLEVAKRVREGAIGRPISGMASYLWSMIVHPDPATTPEERLRFWYQSRALSGDAIVEQDIHTLDVATWLLDAAPLSAVGGGGRAVRKQGETWDHFTLTYTFPDEVNLAFVSQKGVPGIPDEIRCRLFGTEGNVDTDYSGPVFITGKHPYPGGSAPDIYTEGAKRNIATFYNQITAGDCANPTVAPSVRSNLTSILGRMAAYAHGREVTWSEMMAAGEILTPDLAGLKS
jgi:predicted dehydrogenase